MPRGANKRFDNQMRRLTVDEEIRSAREKYPEYDSSEDDFGDFYTPDQYAEEKKPFWRRRRRKKS